MGEVYAAVHERIQQPVALKLITPDRAADREARARLLGEARALAKLALPGVVRILYCDELPDGTIYVAMERLGGLSLRAWLRQRAGPLPIADAAALSRRVAEIMAAVHERNIVHRDLKPENIFLRQAPGAQAPSAEWTDLTILDFGIAKVPPADSGAAEDTQLRTGDYVPMGTAAYMAPEQILGAAEATSSADVYTLGVLLVEMLAGSLPARAAHVLGLLQGEALPPGLPAPLQRLASVMLARDPTARPSMAQVAAVLSAPLSLQPDECPFPGMEPFQERHAALFFGREADSQEALSLLGATPRGYQRWLRIEGPSGAGKSSLVRACLVPRLRATNWRLAFYRPGCEPLLNLAQALRDAAPGDSEPPPLSEMLSKLAVRPHGLRDALRELATPPARLLLIIDQMAELFTLDPAAGAAAGEQIASALADRDGPLHVLSTLRDDFLPRLQQHRQLGPLVVRAARYPLRQIPRQILSTVIQRMVQGAGLHLSEGLAERMAQDAGGVEGALPLLGHALVAHWQHRAGDRLTHEGYEHIGTIGGALSQQAEGLLLGLEPVSRARAKWLLLELVQIGRGTQDTRRPRTCEELLAAAGPECEPELWLLSGGRDPLVPRGAGATLRLITLSGDPGTNLSLQRVELIHESVLRSVPTLAAWIEQERPLLERRADLDAAAAGWIGAGCPRDGLPDGVLCQHYRGADLPPAQRQRLPRMRSAAARSFLQAIALQERRRRRARRSMGAALGVVAVLLLASGFLAARAEWQRMRAEQQRADAVTQSFDEIQDLVDDLYWDLTKFPIPYGEHRDRLLKRREVLLRSSQDSSRGLQLLIKTEHWLGLLALHQSTLAEAEQYNRSAERRIERLMQQDPDTPELVAINLSRQGKVALAHGDLPAARRLFSGSIATIGRLQGGPLWRANYGQTLAVSNQELAEALLLQGRADQAAAPCDEAFRLLGPPTSDYGAAVRAEALITCSAAADQVHRLDEAEKLLGGLNAERRWNLQARFNQSRLQARRAVLAVQSGDREFARTMFQKAVELGWEIHDNAPRDKRYILLLAEIWQAYGDLAPDLQAQAAKERRSLEDELHQIDPADQRLTRP